MIAIEPSHIYSLNNRDPTQIHVLAGKLLALVVSWITVTAWSAHIQSFSDPYFPTFGLNTERYGVQVRFATKFSMLFGLPELCSHRR